MSWEIALGIIALFGFVASVGKIVSNNTRALTQLQCTMDMLKETINKDEQTLKDIGHTVGDHEVRLSNLEH